MNSSPCHVQINILIPKLAGQQHKVSYTWKAEENYLLVSKLKQNFAKMYLWIVKEWPKKKIGVCFFGYRLESRAAINQVLLIQQKKQRRISLLLNTSHQRGSLVVYRSLLQTSGYTTFFCKPYIQLSHSKTKQYTYWLFPLYTSCTTDAKHFKKSYHIAAAFTVDLVIFWGVLSRSPKLP